MIYNDRLKEIAGNKIQLRVIRKVRHEPGRSRSDMIFDLQKKHGSRKGRFLEEDKRIRDIPRGFV